ncbi:carotenoid biosynthesis protein [Rubrobacter tropicus]|uniref:Carotenoid biosynthesis protein n=1 Tax=Rubrobacter tropicus TaxID=2653851 RepID=A0A6G8QBS1_9ACTN|nr:carotenoid biosynthesis protein [Rubrobacter tropicus]QIN83727.1 carotenoid biosynthesis protein [Rubrobacter tropicus]
MLSHLFRPTPRPLLLASALAFFAAFFATRFPDVPGASVGSYVSTALIAFPSFVALFVHLGPRRALLSILTVSAFAYAIESIGVATGFPYGTFFYGDALGPKLFGLVPYLLPVTYVPLVIGAVAAAWSPGRIAPRVLFSALLLVGIDAVLDPGATALGFWIWPEGGPYYGVPLSNFAGWLVSGAVSAALLLSVGRPRTPPPPGSLDSLILATAFWTGTALFSGLIFPVLLGVLLFAFFLHRRSYLRSRRK